MSDKNDLKILQLIQKSNMPIGANYLSAQMGLPQATLGRMLLMLENRGFLAKISNKGRTLTEEGIAHINQQAQWCEKMKTAQNIIATVESKSKHKLYEILEIRMALESLTAERACANVTDEDMGELDNIMLEHFYNLRSGGVGCEQDLQLHLKIADLSGNHTLRQILGLILTEENAYTKFSIVAPHITAGQLRQHTDIVEAIKIKDGKKAKEAMLNHLRQVMENVQKYYTT